MDWLTLIERGDADRLAEVASELVGHPLPPAEFLAECRAMLGRLHRHGEGWIDWSYGADSTWATWIRIRAESFRPPHRPPPIRHVVTGTLHVGFVGIPETAEQVALLPIGEEPEAAQPEPARTRLAYVTALIRAVNSVAARVTGIPKRED